jgi:hypothetical protein
VPRFQYQVHRDADRAHRTSGGLRRTVVCAIGAALGAALVPSVGQAWSLWTTNSIELDPGSCGQMLQVGSDPTASSSATPSFMLSGDGGLSSYAMAVDGVPIGTFTSTGRGVVCIQVKTPLSEGPHVLTGSELAPRPSMAVPAFRFSVDTTPPTPPSLPVLMDYCDSGATGDGITKYGTVSVAGNADPGDRVQVSRENGVVVGGATADSSRHWLATTTPLADGVYTLSAVTLDRAGNRSAPSGGVRLVVDTVAPVTPGTPAVAGVGSDGRTVVSGSVGLDVATLAVYVDGNRVGTTSPNGAQTWRFALPALDPGTVTVTVAAADAADNWSATSAPASVTIASAPPETTPPPVTAPPAAAPIFVPPPSESPPGGGRPAPPDMPLPEGRRPPPPRR